MNKEDKNKPDGSEEQEVQDKEEKETKAKVTKQKPTKRKPTRRKTAKKPLAKVQEENMNAPVKLPMLAMRGGVFFPGGGMSFEVARKESLISIKQAMAGNRMLFLTAQKDPTAEEFAPGTLHDVGTVAQVMQMVEVGDQQVKLMCQGIFRAKALRFDFGDNKYLAEVVPLPDEPVPESRELELVALRREIIKHFEKLAMITPMIPPETVVLVKEVEDLQEFCELILINLKTSFKERQQQLEETRPIERCFELLQLVIREVGVAKLAQDINQKVGEALDQNQKEFYLREQARLIQEELGEGEQQEAQELRELLEKSNIPEEHKEKINKEIDRFSRMPPNFPETSVQRNWLELLLDLPFGKLDKEQLDVERAQKILDRDHYGLKKVKERIVEYVAVRSLQVAEGDSTVKGSILCLVGPPGVGKTSIARSIAEALGRRYVRMSLGGVRDEAEIRGHRRTYVGAMPGRIISSLRYVGADNPLFLLDEIDKLGADFRGDPASALLEVLDPEQNNSFRDHYIELPYDLSKVLFITTANSSWDIPEPLLDRMELIEVNGYTDEEKLQIARRHLLPKQIEQHALNNKKIRISNAALKAIINGYTAEAGVRQLDREMAHLCRRIAMKVAKDKVDEISIGVGDLEKMLGRAIYSYDKADKKDRVGCVMGLAWTAAGGDTLTIEVNVMRGTGKLDLTGHLGDVMKESAKAALSYVRSNAQSLGLDERFADVCDVHIHVPAGAVPKDGPSAGITLATALASALTGKPARHELAMTGEITLRGQVLKIGGLKEKAVAAKRAGVKEILIPKDNLPDTEDIPESVLKTLKITPVSSMDEVFKIALQNKATVSTAATEFTEEQKAIEEKKEG